MKLTDITIGSEPLELSSDGEVTAAIRALGLSRFPDGYREYVTTLGIGVLGGYYIRTYAPTFIVSDLHHFRSRWAAYWFWDKGRDVLPKARALECVIVADTLDGDEILFHPSQPDDLFVLPRYHADIYALGPGLLPAFEWLCQSGVLTEAYTERVFYPASYIPPPEP